MRIVTYNILAEPLASINYFPYVKNPKWLEWLHRKNLILNQIETHDIVCLQEVSISTYYGTFMPHLVLKGYNCCFFPKTTSASEQFYKQLHLDHNLPAVKMYFQETAAKDEIGNAIFWKIKLFDTQTITYIPLNNIWQKQKRRKKMFKYSQPQVAAIALLKCKKTGIVFLVCNVHITPLYKMPEVQLAQVAFLLEQLNYFVDAFFTHGLCERDIPMFICGDFNSTPSSGVYKLLRTSCVEATCNDLATIHTSKGEFAQFPSTLPIVHYLGQLISAHQFCNGTEPLFTNNVPDFSNCIDYIWCRLGKKNELTLEHAQVRSNNCDYLPNENNPSDHLSLSLSFSFCSVTKELSLGLLPLQS